MKSLTDRDEFTVTFELVPGRGSRGGVYRRALEFAAAAIADGRIREVSITENAGGHPAASPEVMGTEIKAMGLDVIVHLSCKDRNRNQMESQLFSWDRIGLHNLLVIAGDYPQRGYRGHPKPVFDLDTVQALDLISRLNCQQGADRRNPIVRDIPPTSFVKGVAVSPFKFSEAELMGQYWKLHAKARAGADYVITQVGYDPRKFHELLLFMEKTGLALPVLGNVFVPTMKVAAMMHRKQIPGCVIPDGLFRRMEDEARAPDRGRAARLERGAMLLAVLRGMGYAGAHVGGPGLGFAEVAGMLDRAEALLPAWRDLVPELSSWPREGFFYFRSDPATGLNRPEEERVQSRPRRAALQRVSGLFHRLLFDTSRPTGRMFARFCLAAGRAGFAGLLDRVEYLIKLALYGCQHCGDCTLGENAFLCVQRGCAKGMLNGPCGGSRDGYCEVFPGRRRCVYVRMYERMGARGFARRVGGLFIVPRDWSLDRTSSWLSFFKGRDHHDLRK
jgi:methylenetetrahydrofolate reductase (NADPH)